MDEFSASRWHLKSTNGRLLTPRVDQTESNQQRGEPSLTIAFIELGREAGAPGFGPVSALRTHSCWACAKDHLSVEAGPRRENHHRLAVMKKTKQTSLSSRKKSATVSDRRARRLTQDEIDERVVAQADDDSAWEPLVHVSRKRAAIGLPGSLAQRAAFLARLHRERNLQTWIEKVIRERVELEERAFTQARRELGSKSRRLTSR